MKKFCDKIKLWCNTNQGILNLLTLIVAVIATIPFNKIDLGFTITFWDKVKVFIIYEIKIPVYLFLLFLFIGIIYFVKIRRNYQSKRYNKDFLIGTWLNEWNIDGNEGSETFEITDDGKYLVNKEHIFTIKDFKIDYATNEIMFKKSAIRNDDNRNFANILLIKNNNLLIGKENNYNIKYKRLI